MNDSRELTGEHEQAANQEPEKLRGGARPGAGRKPKWKAAATRVMRVPEQYAGIVRALILHLDETSMINQHYTPVTSKPLFLRSITGQPQHVTFTTAPLRPSKILEELDL